MSFMKSIIQLLRPQQWVKNGFVFLPMFFSGNLFDGEMWVKSIWIFIAFSLAASSIYCLNDIKDAAADRLHPVKKLRPVASGKINRFEALSIMAALITGAILMSWFLTGCKASAIIAAYIVLNIMYCLGLKKVAIVDVFIISIGFVLRVVAGGVADGIMLSPWIILMTFLLALFLAFAKRRDDVILYQETKVVVRSNIVNYNLPFLDQTLGLLGCMTIVCYIMYSVSPEVEARFNCRYVYITSFFVLAGILRYLQISMVNKKSGSPTKILLKDRFIQIVTVCWILAFVIILY